MDTFYCFPKKDKYGHKTQKESVSFVGIVFLTRTSAAFKLVLFEFFWEELLVSILCIFWHRFPVIILSVFLFDVHRVTKDENFRKEHP